MRLKPTYSSREVAAATGLTARQLQIWDAGGLMRAAFPAHPTLAGGYTERRYTPTEVLELLVLADLRRRGLSVHQLQQVVQALAARFAVSLFEATGGGRKVQLLSDGERVFVRTAAGEFYNLLEDPAQPLLDVGDDRELRPIEPRFRRRGRGRQTPPP